MTVTPTGRTAAALLTMAMLLGGCEDSPYMKQKRAASANAKGTAEIQNTPPSSETSLTAHSPWFAANLDSSSCISIPSLGSLIDVMNSRGESVSVREYKTGTPAQFYKVDVIRNLSGGMTSGTMTFYKDLPTCEREQVAPGKALADRYR